MQPKVTQLVVAGKGPDPGLTKAQTRTSFSQPNGRQAQPSERAWALWWQ